MERILIEVASPAPMTSEIIIMSGLPSPLLPERSSRSQSVVITQPGAARIAADVADRLGGSPMIEVPDRDEAKTLSVAEGIYRELATLDIGRSDTIVGVGGGAVTDLAGFVAATWLRGVESVLVPTTLLGAVDAAIGGKTGINLAGKNLVGAFHLPSRVVIDLGVLAGMSEPLKLEGMAEALKSGLVGDASLVELFVAYGLGAPLDQVVSRSVRVKAQVVEEDLGENGRRAILNFGHTIGHAIEIVGGMPHGLAVAVGMVAAGRVSARRYGFPHQWLVDLIFSLGLPVAAAGLSSRAVRDLMARDKKRTAESIRMVLLRGVGDPVVDLVSDEDLTLALEAVGIDD